MATPDVSKKDSQSKKVYPDGLQRIIIFSGKRKSGKDFLAQELYKRISDSCLITLSGPIKAHYIKNFKVDSEKIFGSDVYKEEYRKQMAKWGEKIRNEDYGYFCRAALDMYNAQNKSIWVITDARRSTDLKWFYETYGDKCKTVRISATEETRKERGWMFTEGIDDAETECDLDDVQNWDLQVSNDGQDVEIIIKQILALL